MKTTLSQVLRNMNKFINDNSTECSEENQNNIEKEEEICFVDQASSIHLFESSFQDMGIDFLEKFMSWITWSNFIHLFLFVIFIIFILFISNHVKLIYGAKYSFWPNLNVKSSSFINKMGYSTAWPTKLPLPSLNLRILLEFASPCTSAATVTLSSGIQPKTSR